MFKDLIINDRFWLDSKCQRYRIYTLTAARIAGRSLQIRSQSDYLCVGVEQQPKLSRGRLAAEPNMNTREGLHEPLVL